MPQVNRFLEPFTQPWHYYQIRFQMGKDLPSRFTSDEGQAWRYLKKSFLDNLAVQICSQYWRRNLQWYHEIHFSLLVYRPVT